MAWGKRLLRLHLEWWPVFLASTRWVAALFAELVRRLSMATLAVSMVGKEFALASRRLDLGIGGSTGTTVLVGRQGRGGRHLLAHLCGCCNQNQPVSSNLLNIMRWIKVHVHDYVRAEFYIGTFVQLSNFVISYVQFGWASSSPDR
jgi:hypothetical protein